MTNNTGKRAKAPPPVMTREESRTRLLKKLTPAGKRFARQLGKALNDEFTILSCNGADMIRAHIAEEHLSTAESVDAMNDLAMNHAKTRITSYYMIMNHAAILLSSGKMHRSQGMLTDMGEQLLQIWLIYSNRLEDLEVVPHEAIEKKRQDLMAAIAKVGKPASFSLSGAVKSLFKRGAEGKS